MRLAPAAALGTAVAAGFAWYHGAAPTSQLFGATVCRVPASGRRIALTYDDGPHPRHTEEIMQALERFGARGTFFVVGRWAEREPGLIRELADRGHAIGNHTFSHPAMSLRSAGKVREELCRCRGAVESAGRGFSTIDGRAPMRPPYGRRRPGTLGTVRAEGYVPVLWSVTCFDWRRRETAEDFTKRALKARDGDIVLLHDGDHRTPRGERAATVATTVTVLERLTAEGYRFVTVPELVALGRRRS